MVYRKKRNEGGLWKEDKVYEKKIRNEERKSVWFENKRKSMEGKKKEEERNEELDQLS